LEEKTEMASGNLLRRLQNGKRALSPAISTVILTSAIVVMLLVAVFFANSYLNGQIAKNEFDSMKQFMQSVGLQVDDVAWIPGRTQTLTYTTKYGQVTLRSPALIYNFFFDGLLVYSRSVSAILFNMPTSNYGVSNSYFQEIFPSSSDFLQNGTSAPICRIFAVEQTPMPDGSHIRIVVTPIVRQLNAQINNVSYTRFYIPILNQSVVLQPSHSVTLTGLNVDHQTFSNVNNVTITIDFPASATMGLTPSFFNFTRASQTVILGSNSIVEIYGGNVTVSLGLST
jgi:hypothetical protein